MTSLSPLCSAVSLSRLDAAIPRRLFAGEAENDLGRLAQVARVLLCLDVQTLHSAVLSTPRLHKALHGLLHLGQWPDLLERNPALIVNVLPLMRLYQRLEGPRLEHVLSPLKRLLQQRYLEQGEWMPLYQLELSVGLLELGYRPLRSLEEARAQTLLDMEVPGWVWCFEKTSVLDFLMLVVGGAGWTLPEAWQETCRADLVHALRLGDALAVGRTAFHYALSEGPLGRSGQKSLLERAWASTAPTPAKPWDETLGHAYLAVSLLREEKKHVCTL